MSRTDYHTNARDSVAGGTSGLSPDDGIVLGLTCVDLAGEFLVRVSEWNTQNTRLRLIDIVRDEMLISRLLHERAPTWHELHIL